MPPPDIMAQLGPGFDPRSETWIFARHRVGDYYHHLNFSCGEHTLCWCDEQSPPRLLEHGVVANTAKRVIVTEEHEIYWTVDQVQIDLSLVEGTWPALAASGQADAAAPPPTLRVSLLHSMPNMQQLLIKINSEPWTGEETYQYLTHRSLDSLLPMPDGDTIARIQARLDGCGGCLSSGSTQRGQDLSHGERAERIRARGAHVKSAPALLPWR